MSFKGVGWWCMKKKQKKTARRAKRMAKRSRRVLKHKKTIKRIKSRKAKPRKKIVKRIKKAKKARRVKRTRRAKISKPKIFIGKGILEQLFESQAKIKLMKFFFRNAGEAFQLKDILKMLRANVFTVRREMKKLEKVGIIKKTRKQNKVVYILNPEFDFLKELKDLILKSTISSKQELINNVRKIGNVKLLVLAGIFRGRDGGEADLLVVGDKINQRKFSTFLKDLEAEVGKELNCALMSSKEFNYRYDMYDRFVRDLISENSDVLINKLNLW
jgi:hypothetical protein